MFRTILATSLLLAACAGDANDAADQPSEGNAPATPAASMPQPEQITNSPESIATATFAPSLGIDLTEFQQTETGLYWKDLEVGSGTLAQAGSTVNVAYNGQFPDGSSFEKGSYQFRVGARQVIDGWDQGIPGMKVGGKRVLIIPSSLGYGPAANGKIPGNATLIFEVELLAAQ